MIEIHNILLAGGISSVLSCLLFLPIWHINKELRGTQHWMMVLVLLVVQIVSFVLQPTYLNTGWLIFQNGIGIATPLFILMGIRQFYGLPSYNQTIIGILAFTLIGFTYCLLFEDININDDIKILVIRAEWTALLAMSIHTVLKQTLSRNFSETFFIIICCVIAFAMDYHAFEIMLPGLKHSIPFPMYSYSLILILFLMPSGFLLSFTLLCMEKRQEHINALKHQAERQTEYQRNLLLTLSHELRTPLNAIAGKGQLMKQGVNDPAQLNDFDTIIKSAMNLADMTSQILDYSHLASQQHPLAISPVAGELKPNIESVIAEAISLIGTKELTIELELSAALASNYLLDWPRLHRVVLNLIANSIKFSHAGPITLRITPDRQTGYLSFEVEDNGIGIPEADIPLLLEPFHRGSNVKDSVQGSGLGLTIVKELLASMGSHLNIVSHLTKGSRFYFSLPAPLSNQAPARARAEKSLAILTHLNILLIEDNSLNYEIMLVMLQQDKHQVILAKDAKTAISLTQTTTFDLILLDMRLPDMSGTELFQQFKKRSNMNQHTPVVVVTANVTQTARQEYALLGLNYVVSKPIDQQTLRDTIHASQEKDQKKLTALVTQSNEEPAYDPLFTPKHLLWLKDNLQPKQFNDYLQNLPEMLAQFIQQAHQAIQRQDSEGFRATMHKLSGSAAQVGLSRLAKKALALESCSIHQIDQEKIGTLSSLCTLSVGELQQAGRS